MNYKVVLPTFKRALTSKTEKMNTYNQYYSSTKAEIEKAIKGNIPNIKAFKKAISDLKKKIKLVACRMQFACSDEEVRLAEIAVERLRGTHDAYRDVLGEINAKMK